MKGKFKKENETTILTRDAALLEWSEIVLACAS